MFSIAFFLIKDDPSIPPFAEDFVLPLICGRRVKKDRQRERERRERGDIWGWGRGVATMSPKLAKSQVTRWQREQDPSGPKGDDSEPSNK